jgi:sodium-dependent dicarboxylate transporter 2/3/5
VALLGGALLFLPKGAVFHWKDVQKEIDWGGVLLIAGGLCIGRLLAQTGAAEWLARMVLGRLDAVPAVLRVSTVILAVHVLHLAFSSNSVTGTIIIPLLIALCRDLRMDPWVVCGPAAFTCSQGFILVTETPTNVIPYSTGYFRIGDMAKAGAVFTLLATACLTVVMIIVGHLAGRPVF